MHCIECGGKLILNSEGELVCQSCGLIHLENKLRKESYFIPDGIPSQGYIPAPLEMGTFLPYRVDECSIRASSRINSKIRRLSRLNLYSKASGDRSMHYRVYKTLFNVTQKIGLPKHVAEYAYILYLKSLKTAKRNLNGKLNHYRFSAACLIAASRKQGFSVRIDDILKLYRGLGHRVTKSNLLEAISLLQKYRLYEKASVADRVEKIIPVIAKKIFSDRRVKEKIGERNVYLLERKVCHQAILLLHRIDQRRLQGKNPYILALALFYISFAAICKRRIISQGYISRKFGYSLSALRNNIKHLYTVIGGNSYS